jgi:hypothetical protein
MEPGDIVEERSREMTPGEWSQIAALVTAEFWTAEPFEFNAANGEGTPWIVEVREGGVDHVKSRRSPRSGVVCDIGLALLRR